MKNILLAACIIMSLIFLNACNEQGIDYDTSLPASQPKSLPAAADSAKINTAIEQMIPAVSVPSNTAGNRPALNPEHGQPGHRCDIAVGAPLNSPTQQAPSIPAQPTQNILTNTNREVTLNPPHGQPGHDCAIPVGQPLKG